MYKNNNRFRNDKAFKGQKMVMRTLQRLKDLNLKEVLKRFSEKIYDRCQKILDVIQNTIETIDANYEGEEKEMRLGSIEKVVKSTVVGHIFLPLITRWQSIS